MLTKYKEPVLINSSRSLIDKVYAYPNLYIIPQMWGSYLNLNSTLSVGSQYLIQMIPAGVDQKKNEKIV